MSFLKLPYDPTKRYLIVGDIHGQLQSLSELLSAASYDANSDILITVGDMIDRGPDSVDVVEFFEGKDRYSVMGNHEYMAIHRSESPNLWMANGGLQTVASVNVSGLTVDTFVQKLTHLPLVLEVGDKFRVAHADIPGAWTDEDIQYVAEQGTESLQQHLLWSRVTVQLGEQEGDAVRKIPTYCGHSRLEASQTIGDITFIDRVHKLMAINPMTKETWEVEAPYV